MIISGENDNQVQKSLIYKSISNLWILNELNVWYFILVITNVKYQIFN